VNPRVTSQRSKYVCRLNRHNSRALHTELQLEYSSRNSSWNEFFVKIKIRFWRYKFRIYFTKHTKSRKEHFWPQNVRFWPQTKNRSAGRSNAAQKSKSSSFEQNGTKNKIARSDEWTILTGVYIIISFWLHLGPFDAFWPNF